MNGYQELGRGETAGRTVRRPCKKPPVVGNEPSAEPRKPATVGKRRRPAYHRGLSGILPSAGPVDLRHGKPRETTKMTAAAPSADAGQPVMIEAENLSKFYGH